MKANGKRLDDIFKENSLEAIKKSPVSLSLKVSTKHKRTSILVIGIKMKLNGTSIILRRARHLALWQ